MKDMNKKNLGYTIIELLAVMSILVTISGVIASVLYTTLRGSSKVKISSEVSQNGTYAISTISNIIKDSRSVVQVGAVRIPDDQLDCTDPAKVPAATSIILRRLDNGLTTLSCKDVNGVYSIASDSAALSSTLTNPSYVKVVTGSCTFTCTQNANDPYALPIIKVNFQLSDKGATVQESQSSQTFQTSVSLNNFLP